MGEITAARGAYRESGLGWPPDGIADRTRDHQSRTTGGTALPAAGMPGTALESGLGFRLGRAHRLAREVWGRAIADLDLSPPQSALLRAVAEEPGLGVRELARRMRTDPMNVKRLADHLQRAGQLRSVSDPHHRQRRVLRPTNEGMALAAELARRGTAQEDHFAALLGPASLSQLQDLLERFDSALAPAALSKEESR